MGSNAAFAVPTIVALLKRGKLFRERYTWIRLDLIAVLGNCGQSAKAAVPELQRALETDVFSPELTKFDRVRIRVDIADALLRIAPNHKKARQYLFKRLSHPRARAYPSLPRAIEAVGRLGPSATDALPALRKLLRENIDPKRYYLEDVHLGASWAIAQIDPQDKSILPGVKLKLSALSGYSRDVNAAEVAAILGTRAEACIPTLIDAVFRNSLPNGPRSSGIHFQILKHIEPDPAERIVAQAIRYIEGDQKRIWRTGTGEVGFEVIGQLEARAESTVPKLLKWLKDDDVKVRANSARALGRIGRRADDVLPALVDSLSDPRAVVRAGAAEAIGEFGPQAAAHLEHIRKATQDEYLVVRMAANKAAAMIAE